jgi:hypothetical protein
MTLLALFHPALAGFAALFAIPLIIHLLNRRRYRTVPWAAMTFLLQAYKKKRKRLELENLLLLLLRCAIPVVLALAFARPYFGADSLLAPLAEPRREVVVVIDESFSMSRRTGTGTQFQGALEQVRRLVAGLDFERGDRVTLATLAREPRLLCVSAAKSDLERKLATLARPTWEPADLGRTLDLLLDDVLGQIPASPELWLLSDFQKNTFEQPDEEGPEAAPVAPPANGAAAAETPSTTLGKMQRLSQQCRLHLVNLSDGTLPPENLAVADLRASEPLAIAGQALRVTATIARSGRQPMGSGHFRIGEADVPKTFVFDAEGKAPAEVYHSFPNAGDVGVEFRLDEDDLPDDDARFLRLPVKSGLPVLVVDGDPSGAELMNGGAWNLLLVLDPHYSDPEAEEGYRRWFDPTVVPWYQLSQSKPDFSKYEAVVFVNVREIEVEHVLPELQNYVDGGGGVLFFLGSQLRPESWNERLWKADGSGLMPMRLASEAIGTEWDPAAPPATAPGEWPYRLEIADELHPAVRTFTDDRRRFYLRSPIFRYWPFEAENGAAPAAQDAPAAPALPASSRVVLRYEKSGAPALIDHRYGRGRTLWFNVSGAEDSWSNFTRTPAAFFPLVWDMMNHLCVRDPGEHDLPIGGAISRGYPAPPLSWTVTAPGGQSRTFSNPQPNPVRGLYRLDPYTETTQPGLYALDVQFGGEDPPVRELFAVNVDPRESELAFLDGEQVRSLYDRVAIASYGNEIAADASEQQPERQGEIWKSLMLALLALVLLETVLAWRFGRYTT